MKILFAGGGSIGHIAPSVAVWRAAKSMDGGAECFFLCSTREEDTAFLLNEKLPHRAIGPRSVNVFSAIPVFSRALSHLRQWKPDVVLTKGGGLTIPIAFAARLLGIPIVAHESDAVMGKGTRTLARLGATICVGFPQHALSPGPSPNGRGGPQRKEFFSGNPIRPEVTQGNRDEGLRLTSLSGSKPILLVYGGSQGAAAINDAIARNLDQLLKTVDIVHLTGKGKPGAQIRPGYWSREFAQDELPHLYSIADLSISRSGAGSISELAACGIPTILVPLRGLAQDHQQSNADAAVHGGGCVILQQESLERTLVPTVEQLATDAERRTAMGAAIHFLHVPDAAEKIAQHVMNCVRRQESKIGS